MRVVLLVVAAAGFVSAAPGTGGAAGFNNGDAQATADAFSLNIKAANATIGFTYGRSVAEYRDRTGSSEGRALDLGALPTLFGGEQCDGSAPLLNPATLPPLTRADSAVAGSEASRRLQVFQPGLNGGPGGAPAGYQDATATPLPSSLAATESVPVDVFLLAMDGARTEVRTKLENQVREATAVVTADELRVFGGLFTFREPRWEAVARSGAATTSQGTFTFRSATVLGIPRSPTDVLSDLAGFKTGLEQLLAPFGVVLDLPRVEVLDDGVRVTPMGFRVVDPPFGTDVLIPFLGAVDPLVQALRQQAVETDCKNQTVLTVVDVLLGVLGGSGSIEILAGGVQATTHDVDYTVPAFPEPTVEATETLPPDTTPAYAEPLPFTDAGTFEPLSDLGTELPLDTGFEDLSVDGEVPAVEAAEGEEREVVALPAASSRWEDGAAGAAGVAVGALALLGAVGLSVGDRVVGSRRRRSIP